MTIDFSVRSDSFAEVQRTNQSRIIGCTLRIASHLRSERRKRLDSGENFVVSEFYFIASFLKMIALRAIFSRL